MNKPKESERWCLKSDASKVLKVRFVNCCDIVGFSDANWRKRTYGTLKMDTFLERFERVE